MSQKLSKKAPKGFRDFFPKEYRKRQYMFDMMKKTAESYSYQGYDGPVVEELALYQAKSGQELINEQVYSFEDRGGRMMCIRPEMTPTLARMVSNIHREMPKPIRLYSIPNLLRYERPQRGRVREHWQYNVDIFGYEDRDGEVEILQVLVKLLSSFGANESHFSVKVNDRAIVDHVFTTLLSLSEEQTYELYKVVDKSKKVDENTLDSLVQKIGLSPNQTRTFKAYLSIENFSELKKFLAENNGTEVFESFLKIYSLCESLGISKYLEYDPAIVRGLDYYTGLVFEAFDKNPANPRAICGGGAYANLLQLFNEKPLGGVGFGLGDVTLQDFLETHELMPDLDSEQVEVFITFQDNQCKDSALKAAEDLRHVGFRVMSNFASIKLAKAIGSAQKKNSQLLGLLGDQELEKGVIILKHLELRSQVEIKLKEISALSRKDILDLFK